jgi:hypothetical protein
MVTRKTMDWLGDDHEIHTFTTKIHDFNDCLGIQYCDHIPPETDLKSIYGETTFYDPNGCETFAGISTSLSGAEDGTIYKSGLQPPYILEQFMIHILKRLAQKYNKPETDFVTQEHVIALLAFAQGEGGDIQNSSIFNPMNTSYRDEDVQSIAYAVDGRDGRQAYPSFDIGIEAYARHMSRPDQYQNRLGTVLSDPTSTAAQFMEALTYFERYDGNKTWATAALANPDAYYRERLALIATIRKNYASYAGLVIGTPALEQKEGIRQTSLIFYKDLVNASEESNTDLSTLSGSQCEGAPLPNGSGTFTTNTSIVYPGIEDALRRAKAIAVLNSAAFNTACDGRDNCYQRCDHLAGEVWGYATSGYKSAKVHWEVMLSSGKGNPNDRNPPVGALLFYESGVYGHIATYLGNGVLLSNDVLDDSSGVKGGAYIVPTDSIEKGPWRLKYLGWSDPVFAGGIRSPSL